MRTPTWIRPLGAVLALTLLPAAVHPIGGGRPEGQMTWAVHVSIAPTWFDPGEHPGIITSLMIFYALHDALVKPMPGKPTAPILAESWTVSPDGLVYEFVLRRGVVFHNGDAMTAEDVKFSFERYRGAAAKLFKEKVAAVEVVDPLTGPLPADASRGPTSWRSTPRPPPAPAGSCPRHMWRRSAKTGSRRPRRRRAVQARLLHAGRGAGPGGARALLAQAARSVKRLASA